MKRLAVSLAFLAALSTVRAGAMEPTMHAGELAHELDRLAVTGRVLYVAAHPDDENTRLLAYLAGARHLQVAYLSMTRGGGGQNLIGGEQGELLDVIRTEELLAARRIDGATQRFTRMRDFGYSKSAEETFATWGHEEALADVVWVIRTFQPDVIITRFGENPPNHGHHTASAVLAREAFAAAADPRRFPEQLANGVQTWQAERLLHNVPTWGGAPEPPPGTIELDVGVYDARLGVGYGELAARSRSQHKSQGFGVAGERGKIVEKLAPVAGSKPRADLTEGITLDWTRFGKAALPYARALGEARATLDRDQPEQALPALVRAHDALASLPDVPRVRDARRALARIIAAAAGVYVRATAAAPFGVPGTSAAVSVEIVARSSTKVTLASVSLPGVVSAAVTTPLERDEKKLVAQAVPIPADAPVSTPYWLAESPAPGRYQVREQALVGAPAAPAALVAQVALTLANRTILLEVPVVHTWVDPVHGERTRAFLIVPPATVTPTRDAVMLPNGRSAPVLVRVRAAKDAVKGEVTLDLPDGWKSTPPAQPVELVRAGSETTVRFEVTPPRAKAGGAGAGAGIVIHPAIRVDGKRWAFREDRIDHAHIPLQAVLQPSRLRLQPLALRLPGGVVGYVRGSGDSVAEDLAHVGVKIEYLDDETLRSGKLGRYAAIVVGIRAYNTRDMVRAAHARLMDYVAKGGTVVVQYNTNNRLSPLTEPIGPCAFEIGRDRITDENAAVVPVDAKEPLLRAPNAIDAADFTGWVQERGIYFASKWDKCYRPLFRIADAGEAPLEGGTLVAKHGKGRYVYTGLAFFRQLPAGVPGAYRLMANFIAASGSK